MKCSLGISNFLEDICSLSHSVVSLYFFALITEEDFLISPGYSLELCIQMGISFLLSFAFIELYKKGLNDLYNHNGVITHLEPDILECEIRGGLESITANKASGGDGS